MFVRIVRSVFEDSGKIRENRRAEKEFCGTPEQSFLKPIKPSLSLENPDERSPYPNTKPKFSPLKID
jgi:hypothetical protein